MRARDAVLETLLVDLAGDRSVFDVLLATGTQPAPFRGRRDDLARLERWWEERKQPVAVVTGAAGVGKTRLVTEFAQRRSAPWMSGWLSEGRGAEVVAAIRACGDPALILVDDADQRPDLADLLASLKTNPGTRPEVRVILISRAAGLAGQMAPELKDRHRGLIDGIRELPLGRFGGADDRARWFGEAVRAYAKARQVPPPDLPAHLGGYVTDPAEPILTLHAHALLAVLDSEFSRPMRPRAEAMPFDQIAAALFAHEQQRWLSSARRLEFGLTDLTSAVQAQAIAALLLAGPNDWEQAEAALRRVPELSEAQAERRGNILRWVAHLYPGDPPWPIQIKPDMLAEWFAVTQLAQSPGLAGPQQLMTPAQKDTLLVVMAKASDHVAQAVKLFADIVASDPSGLAEAAITAALTASTGRQALDGELASLICRTTWSADTLGRIEEKLTNQLPRTWEAVAEAQVKIARAGPDTTRLATALGTYSIRLVETGRYQEALAAAEEAAGMWRQLARDDPAYQPDLAATLNNLSVRRAELGRSQEALAAAEEAAGMWRRLARDDPAHQPDLAATLNNLSVRRAELGRSQEALAAAEESIGMWRRLARDNPVQQPDLASAVNNCSARFGDLGRYQEALAAGQEAAGMWRQLARDDPAHQPNLAATLSNLSIRLSDLGRDQEALAPAEESVDIRRQLARDNRAYQPDLASALNILGNRLADLGRYQQALAAAQEAVSMWRQLARDNPANQYNLAEALGNFGTRLGQLGRDEEALAAAEEDIGLWQQLTQDNTIYLPSLATVVDNLGVFLGRLSRSLEAVAAAEEAVGMWRPIARDNHVHQPRLAKALGHLGLFLREVGRGREALVADEEAVELWRSLARSYPDQYQDTYNRKLAEFRRTLDLQQQETASILLHLADSSLDGDQPRHS